MKHLLWLIGMETFTYFSSIYFWKKLFSEFFTVNSIVVLSRALAQVDDDKLFSADKFLQPSSPRHNDFDWALTKVSNNSFKHEIRWTFWFKTIFPIPMLYYKWKFEKRITSKEMTIQNTNKKNVPRRKNKRLSFSGYIVKTAGLIKLENFIQLTSR